MCVGRCVVSGMKENMTHVGLIDVAVADDAPYGSDGVLRDEYVLLFPRLRVRRELEQPLQNVCRR